MNKYTILSCLLCCCMVLYAKKEKNATDFRCIRVDPLEKIVREQASFTETTDTVIVARGETASFQFVAQSIYPVRHLAVKAHDMESGSQRISPTLKAFVGYTYSGSNYHRNPAKDKILSVSGYMPDPLLEIESTDMDMISLQPVWISYTVPRNAAAGFYRASITISGETNGKTVSVSHTVCMKVYDVTLPDQTLWVTHWEGWYPNEMKYLNGGVVAEMYSERHRELITLVANKMRDHGQNVYRVPSLWTKFTLNGDTYSFDFSRMDWLVDILIREGNLKRMTLGHAGQRMGGWYDPYGLFAPDSSGAMKLYPYDSPIAKNFWSQFYPALYRHLKEKGWDKIAWQYVADEPGTGASAKSYTAIAVYLKSLVPELPVIEAIHSTKEVIPVIDIVVPLLDALHRDYASYLQYQAAGKEIWFYTCMEPYGADYANRFIEQPLIKTRIIHWINYRYRATGYLHWAFKSWRNDVLNKIPDWGSPTQAAGDCWIVYPAYNKIYSSIRLEAMRDGINDYELLRLLEKKNPDGAKELAEGVVKDFNSYDTDIVRFRERRMKMLQWLSK